MKRAVLLCLCCVMFLFSACKKSPPSPEAPEESKKIEQEKAEVPELPGDVSSNGDSGEGTGPDYAEAVKRCREAAEQGNAEAQNNLGLIYRNGYGVDQDDAEAAKWYRKAAEQDHAIAQSNLSLMYANGLGVEQDYIEAYKWILLAGINGHYDDPVITLMESAMEPHEMDEGRRLANEHIEQKKQKETSPK